ncbi:hypothetical protein [Kitasatospora sp. NPDC086791]|uniref:hypothetical protein n=1 Tax=Kitasatospora sp. NPDC086791 TaxID=3155178 RepID=UPI003428B311
MPSHDPTGGPVQPSAEPGDAVPLGPWGGAQVVVWRGRTGTLWHADPNCHTLRSRAVEEVFTQPDEGTLGDRKLPENVHCLPPGLLRDYLLAARKLAKYERVTTAGHEQLADGQLPVIAFGALTALSEVNDALEGDALESSWRSARRRRDELVDQARPLLAARLPQLLAAQWVLTGKTARQYQRRYTDFADAVIDAFENDGLAFFGLYEYVTKDLLPRWLEDVTAGHAPGRATERMAAEEARRLESSPQPTEPEAADRVRQATARIGQDWSRRLADIAASHDGEVIALFNAERLPMDKPLRDLFTTVLPCAHLRTRDFAWTAGRVPAVLGRFFFDEHAGERIGVILERDEATAAFGPATCALFLRNLVTQLGQPDLVDYVEAGDGAASSDDIRADYPAARLRWPHGSPVDVYPGLGMTREDLLPALHAARGGVRFPAPGR